jgi:division protein CdvB (Snf7/Vps24/ESCRT-III family)
MTRLPQKPIKWEEKEAQQPPLGVRVRETFRPSVSLKSRLDFAVSRIEAQTQRLDNTSNRFSERDKSLFAKVVEAYSKHDLSQASAFATELAEIRKVERIVMQAKLALEQIVLRLKTVTELGDMVSTLGPVVGILRNVRTAIVGVLPDAGRELEEIGTMLNGIIADAGQTTGLTLNFETTNEDAQKILAEVATVAEQRIKEKFPELPAGIPVSNVKPATQA